LGNGMDTIHTWESECLPKLDVRNPATGDIGVCTLWTHPSRVSPYLAIPRISLIGPLRTKTGLGWLLRGLYLYPAIRNLVVCGTDLSMTGDALLCLWEEGLTEDNALPKLGWKLHPEMDREAVDLLRRNVKLWDWRGKSPEEVGRDAGDIPYLEPRLQLRSFPPVAIPQPATFPSRKTTFPILAQDSGDGWLQLLNLVIQCGTVKSTRKGRRLAEVLNAIVTIKLASEEDLPSPCFDFSPDEFERHYRHFASVSRSEEMDYTCGERLRNWPWFDHETNGTKVVDQLDRTIDRLRRSRDTKRGVMVLLGPTDLDKLDDAPCIISIAFNVVDERLYGTYVLRSDDIYNAWPLNTLSLIRLQREVSKRIDVPVDSATFISHSAYIYERDWGKAHVKLHKWFKRPLPLQTDPSGLFFFGLDNGRVRAMLISTEVDRVLWEGEFQDPEDLARYIVDTMPWLSPQHFRYLGGESARLTQAIRDGTPYEQG
jgi:thymidylate synthase